MNNQKIIGFAFDGVVIRRTGAGSFQTMAEEPGLKKTLRQINHKGYEVVCVTSRKDNELAVAKHFMEFWGLKLRLVTLGVVPGVEKISTSDLLMYVSGQVNDLVPVSRMIPYVIWYCGQAGIDKSASSIKRRVASHHELITLINKCLS
jgi:hypothetical protein